LTRPRRVELSPEEILSAQLALTWQGISSGSLDGVAGLQTRAALRAFQQREGLAPTGELDEATRARLVLNLPLYSNYIVTTNDLLRLQPVSPTWLGKSQQTRLDYENILELVAETTQAHPELIRQLNPGLDWNAVAAGASLRVPNARYPPPRAKAAFVRVRLAEKILEAFDPSTNLLAHFPCSIARRVEKRPVGELYVASIVLSPNYRFHPDIFPESEEARQLGRPLTIPPGPNNPVGTAWIGLTKPGYGIHGTPHPEEIGRSESHGCFRLANWNAEYLAKLVEIGTRVQVEP
jgi:lipoprotein-anchoring transpeptidase ErfK/SrfK